MLAILIARAKDDGQIEGVIPHLIQNGLSILQYMEDTVLFLSHDLPKATNMKLLLSLFEQLSGLKINFHKSEIFCFGKGKEHEAEYSQLFGYDVGKFPFRYLGLPMHYKKLSNNDWKNIEQRIENTKWLESQNVNGWQSSGVDQLDFIDTYVHIVFLWNTKRGARENQVL